MTEINNAKHLLEQISITKKFYDRLAESSGGNFNIFSIARIQSSELIHSRFLAELLNPKGSHGQRDKFLKSFCNLINYNDLDTTCSKVILEKRIGIINSEEQEGGQIDITITDGKGNGFIIENKVFAYDQKDQILRYVNFCKDKYKKSWRVVYLTLDGKNPSNESISESEFQSLKENIPILSYSQNIKDWMLECQKETIGLYSLNEALKQYIDTISNLTGRNKMKELDNDVVNLVLKDSNSFSSFNTLVQARHKVYDALLKNLGTQLETKAKEINVNFKLWDTVYPIKEIGFEFYTNKLTKVNLKIAFDFFNAECCNLNYGLFKIDSKKELDESLRLELLKKLRTVDNFQKRTNNVPIHTSWNEPNWGEKEFLEIINGDMSNKIFEKVLAMIKALE